MKLNLNNLSLRISAGRPDQIPADPMPQIAFSGRSNVGKSSLINSLTGRKSLARVSGAPGKTITINFYDVDKKDRVCVIALFEAPSLKLAPSRESGALILPCAFDTEKQRLILPDSLPLLRREEFKKLSAFTKNIFKG